jgi:hypothetical protein
MLTKILMNIVIQSYNMKKIPQITMTARQLNARVRKLRDRVIDMELYHDSHYYDTLRAIHDEFSLIYSAAPDFKGISRQNILIMFRINMKYRFISFHQFGINIVI